MDSKRSVSGGGKLITHVCIAWSLRIRGAIPLFPHILSWCEQGQFYLYLFIKENRLTCCTPVAYPGIFSGWGSTNSVEDRGQRGRGSGSGSPLVTGSGGSCNLVQEISFHIVKFSYFLVF